MWDNFGELTKMDMQTDSLQPASQSDIGTRNSGHLDSSLLSIGDMARTFGVSLRTLRFYEGRGLLDPKRDGSSRYYGAEDRRRLKLILKGKQLGFTLAEIREFIAKDRHGNGHALALNNEQISMQINHLERQRKALDEAIHELQARL